MIDKFWIKFDELDIECFCREGAKKCPPEKKPVCKQYVVKFIEIERSDEFKEEIKAIKKTAKKIESEISKAINKFKVR